MKSSEAAENKGFFVICSPKPFIECYTFSINIRIAHKGKNKGSIHQKPYDFEYFFHVPSRDGLFVLKVFTQIILHNAEPFFRFIRVPGKTVPGIGKLDVCMLYTIFIQSIK